MDFTVKPPQNIVSWFIYNPVAANLLMFVIMLLGIYSASHIKLESFPAFPPDNISIKVTYDGSSPTEIEKSIIIKIERALIDIDGIESIESTASRGIATLSIKKREGYKLSALQKEIQDNIDIIEDLPEDLDSIIVTPDIEVNSVVWVSIQGDISEFTLKDTAATLRKLLLQKETINHVNYRGFRDHELTIYTDEIKLQQYQLTIADVADALQKHSLELSLGSLKTGTGDILLSVDEESISTIEYANIPIRSYEDGSQLYLRDIANIDYEFSENSSRSYYEGKPAVMLKIDTVGNTDVIKAYKEAVKTVDEFRQIIPAEIEINLWNNRTREVTDRLQFLSQSGLLSMLLVLTVLAIFLNIKLAFWIAIGIPVSIAGALFLMPIEWFGLSLNTVTLFAFIIVLGIIVDDAIVTGESIYREKSVHHDSYQSTISGIKKVYIPATFGVLTTVAAFIPLTTINSEMGRLLGQIAWVVIFCLIFALIESKLILPSHLRNISIKKSTKVSFWSSIQKATQHSLKLWEDKLYRPLLSKAIRYRYFTCLLFLSVLIFSLGLVNSGVIRTVFFPDLDQEFIEASFSLDKHLSEQEKSTITQKLSSSLREVSKDIALENDLKHPPVKGIYSSQSKTEIHITADLEEVKYRPVSADNIVRAWRNNTLNINGLIVTRFKPQDFDLKIHLYADTTRALEKASKDFEAQLREYKDVEDIEGYFDNDAQQLQVTLNQLGKSKGLNNTLLASQVRDAFHGLEINRLSLDNEEVKVVIKYATEKRENIADLGETLIKNTRGDNFLLNSIADIHYVNKPSVTHRKNRRSVITLKANINKNSQSVSAIVKDLKSNYLTVFKTKHPNIEVEFGGDAKENKKAIDSLLVAFGLSALLIYLLLAIPLKSYIQPLLIISIIPFGLVGVITGHLLLEIPISLLSFFGFLALSGVIINDSLILVSSLSKIENKCLSAIIEASQLRFRAVILTSLTTFVGLIPIIFESSYQAQFLIPLAASLGFGIVFSTAITLILIPVIYAICNDIKALTTFSSATIGE